VRGTAFKIIAGQRGEVALCYKEEQTSITSLVTDYGSEPRS